MRGEEGTAGVPHMGEQHVQRPRDKMEHDEFEKLKETQRGWPACVKGGREWFRR